jgi:hypothetical protein
MTVLHAETNVEQLMSSVDISAGFYVYCDAQLWMAQERRAVAKNVFVELDSLTLSQFLIIITFM